jgi:hypothetical protein
MKNRTRGFIKPKHTPLASSTTLSAFQIEEKNGNSEFEIPKNRELKVLWSAKYVSLADGMR